jgi:hypothetical protein
MGNFVARSMCNYFLGMDSQERRARFNNFPNFTIDNNNFPDLTQAGFSQISMDATGNIEIRQGNNTLSVETALVLLRGNAQATDQLFRCIGREVFNIM